jgi:hypothetical protein
MFTLMVQYVIKPVGKATRLFSALQNSLVKKKKVCVGQVVISAHVGWGGLAVAGSDI